CKTPLSTSSSPVADRERALILRLIDKGKSKDEIKSRLVSEYGPRVLSTPQTSGFSLMAYAVPIILGTATLFGIFSALNRWRRNSERIPSNPATEDDAQSGLEDQPSVEKQSPQLKDLMSQ